MSDRPLINPDPNWQEYVLTYENVIEAIGKKYCWDDEATREDAMQEARLGLYMTYPEKVDGFAEYTAGEMSEKEWKERLSAYCRTVIRNRIATYLKKNNWYYKRTKRVTDPATGKKVKVKQPEVFLRLEDMLATGAVQISEEGQISPDNWQANFDEPEIGLFDESTGG